MRRCLPLVLGLMLSVFPRAVGAGVPVFDGREAQTWIEHIDRETETKRTPGSSDSAPWVPASPERGPMSVGSGW